MAEELYVILEFVNEVQKLLDQNDSRRPKQRLALKNEMWTVKPLSDGQVPDSSPAAPPFMLYRCLYMLERATVYVPASGWYLLNLRDLII